MLFVPLLVHDALDLASRDESVSELKDWRELPRGFLVEAVSEKGENSLCFHFIYLGCFRFLLGKSSFVVISFSRALPVKPLDV